MNPLQTRDTVTEAWRLPSVPEGDAVLFTEPGRVLVCKPASNADACFSAYSFIVTKRHGTAFLRVRHGGGEESWRLPCGVVRALCVMDSDARFFMLHAIMDAHHESKRNATDATGARYMQAFADGRLKKRKIRGSNTVRVWIESPTPAPGSPCFSAGRPAP